MPAMVHDFVSEIGVAPGTGAVTLTGANPDIPCMTWLAAGASTGDWQYYVMTDGAAGGLSEIVMGQYNSTAGTLSRATTIMNNSGGTSPLNFTTPVKVFSFFPASKVLHVDNAGAVNPGALSIKAGTAGNGSAALQMGDATHPGRVEFYNAAGTLVGFAGYTDGSNKLELKAQGGHVGWNITETLDVTSGGLTRITGGNILVGTSVNPTGAAVNIAGATTLSTDSTSGFNVILKFIGTTCGSIITNGSTTAYNTSSDYRIKTTFGPADVGSLIDSVPVYDGAYTRFPGVRRPMMLAHEMPAWAMSGAKDAVDEHGDPVYQQADYMALIPAMWAELQSLRRRVAELEAA